MSEWTLSVITGLFVRFFSELSPVFHVWFYLSYVERQQLFPCPFFPNEIIGVMPIPFRGVKLGYTFYVISCLIHKQCWPVSGCLRQNIFPDNYTFWYGWSNLYSKFLKFKFYSKYIILQTCNIEQAKSQKRIGEFK